MSPLLGRVHSRAGYRSGWRARKPMNTLRKIGQLAGGLLLLSACTPTYARVDYGPDYYDRRWVDVYAYDPYYYGDWRYHYRSWSPVVIYEYGGRYYPHHFPGSRPRPVYRDPGGGFLAPQRPGSGRG